MTVDADWGMAMMRSDNSRPRPCGSASIASSVRAALRGRRSRTRVPAGSGGGRYDLANRTRERGVTARHERVCRISRATLLVA
jgi:hypothetical protein